MNVTFVNYHDFTSPSAIHIVHLANELAKSSHRCSVVIPHNLESLDFLGIATKVSAVTYDQALAPGSPLLTGEGPGIIHAWTPRENVRRMTEVLSRELGRPYVVHMEDNEEAILARQAGCPINALREMSEERLAGLVGEALSHPRRYREFLDGAAGVTTLMDRLLEFVPENKPSLVFWPGCEDEVLDDPPQASNDLRTKLGIGTEERIIVYPGNGHIANRYDLFSLYLAVSLLNRRGFVVRLVRIGKDHCEVIPERFVFLRGPVIELGQLPPADIPRYLALADVLVQPGRADEFNDYRFPSKLTVFLAMGKPVVLPRSNIGRFLEDGNDALLLEQGTALELADRLGQVLSDADLAARLGQKGREFALKHFRWSGKARLMARFYAGLVARTLATRRSDL